MPHTSINKLKFFLGSVSLVIFKEMGDYLRVTVGVMGNAASLLLYAAPILTFTRVIRKRSTEEFSCIPYIFALINCYLYTWYGLPIVSCGWENITIVTINGIGILLELSFIHIYFWFASAAGKAEFLFKDSSIWVTKKVAILTTAVTLIFCISAAISAAVLHNHHDRKMFIGSIGLIASVAMYGSPLVLVKKVLQTQSVEFMPFYLSFFSVLTSGLWLAYGLLSHDLLLASPNLVGCPLGMLQLVLYFKYRKRDIMEEPRKWDVEKADEKPKEQLQIMVTDDSDAKI